MTPSRLLIIVDVHRTERPAGVPDEVVQQIRDADEVHVVAPRLTSRLHSLFSDIDAETRSADELAHQIVGNMGASSQSTVTGAVGD